MRYDSGSSGAEGVARRSASPGLGLEAARLESAGDCGGAWGDGWGGEPVDATWARGRRRSAEAAYRSGADTETDGRAAGAGAGVAGAGGRGVRLPRRCLDRQACGD